MAQCESHMIQCYNLYKPETGCHSNVANDFIYSEIRLRPVHLSSSLARGIGYSNSIKAEMKAIYSS